VIRDDLDGWFRPDSAPRAACSSTGHLAAGPAEALAALATAAIREIDAL
jgi:hypothetical protein